ncbi:MAG: PEGA domain-containing protein, partial [Planctomycetota bacterium]|nr:PEGA domain-containing protein [Planctomycetota bacterium]
AALLFAACLLAGCVERALVVTSEPSGADVTVNQQWKGKTPYVVPFKHYGVYDIWIEHPGFEENGKMVKFYPLHASEPVKAPGYQYAGADFVSEVLLPATLRDQHNLHYVLERVDRADPVEDVLARADQLRTASRLRTEIRYAKDSGRGRRQTGATDVAPGPGTGEYAADYGYLPESELPTPTDLPVFLP